MKLFLRIFSRLSQRSLLAALFLFHLLPVPATADDAEEVSPFVIIPTVISSNGVPFVVVAFRMPERHHLYADKLSIELAGQAVRVSGPTPEEIPDKFNGGTKRVFHGAFATSVELPPDRQGDMPLTVNLQGCNAEECFFPETRRWLVRAGNEVASQDDAAVDKRIPDRVLASLANGFRVSNRASGYLNASSFLDFLKQTDNATGGSSSGVFAGFGLIATLGLILLGGLALNLTPCVLPMIPINLAILGGSAGSGSRKRGFALGGAYGAGMALAYGGLGLAVVLTGSKFGTLNSSSWFNFAIAVVFVVLGLAMLDRIPIDLSRFQRAGGNPGNGGAFATAITMGFISALLAGACVAPVVISVLLLATTFYQQGFVLGLLLPFVLGLGMALPWPFAAAGLSFLPKPGAWMTRVKCGFSVVIFAFAVWYGWLGLNLAGAIPAQARVAVPDADETLQSLRAALERSRSTGKPVLIDFWASWCKNCSAMERGTFRDSQVKRRLDDFVFVKFQAERLNDPKVKPVLDQFGVLGLPTYVVLSPGSDQARWEAPSQTKKN